MSRAAIALAVLAMLASTHPCAAGAAAPLDTLATPAEYEYSYAYDALDNSLIRPATRMLDVARIARKASGHPREAANVDDQDQVRLPSTWWQPRVGFRPVTAKQVATGAGTGTGPAPGRLTVWRTKDQGVTPGFQVKDSKGDKFVLKFDPLGFPDLATSAAVIGARLFWAAGYNVPDDAIAYFRIEDLDIDSTATYTDTRGRKQPITRAYLEKILSRVERRQDGRYRCIASRYLKGKPLGPFEYRGRRQDDPEDRIPHELRRELRGLWTMCAWSNHADSRGPNSLDMWITENGRSFVRHHLIDFSATLGAVGRGKRAYPSGHEYYVDIGVMSGQLATLGLKPFPWEASVDPDMPAVGFVDSETFDPARWRPDYPNPAFDERTERDIRWGARIVAGFTDEHIRAAVSAAKYSDPRAAEYITRILIERRDKLVGHWLGPVVRTPQIAIR
jgi:hypothetical protein